MRNEMAFLKCLESGEYQPAKSPQLARKHTNKFIDLEVTKHEILIHS